MVPYLEAMKRPLNIRRLIPAILLLTLALTLVVGTVYAYMFMRTDQQSAGFSPARVACEVSESFADNTKSSITVKNTGNVDAYLRVRLVTYWVHADEKTVAAESSPVLNITPADGWLEGGNNTFYYKVPVAPGKSTPSLFSGFITLGQKDGLKQVIDVFAEAIQANPEDAVEELLEVYVDMVDWIVPTVTSSDESSPICAPGVESDTSESFPYIA